jgi:hypothetical protein
MSIYVTRNNEQRGPFEEAQVVEMLRNGQLLPSDLGIRQGDQKWRTLGEMFPSSTGQPVTPAAETAEKPRKSRKGLLIGCAGAFLLLAIIAAVAGLFVYRNLFPSDSKTDLPDTVKDFKLNNRYPPKGNIWGTETTFMGIYSNKTTGKTVIYMLTVYSNESNASDAMRRDLAGSCRSGETPMYFKFLKSGAEISEGATCALPFYVRKGERLVTLGGSGAGAEDFIEFAENLPFNSGTKMEKR